MIRKTLASVLLSAALFAPTLAAAQSDEGDIDDVLGDILGEDPPVEESSGSDIAEERRAVEEGDLNDTIGVKSEDIVLPEDQGRKRRIIKTLQRKDFLKIGRYEVAPAIGAVTNDAFINRYLLGASFTYHATEIFGVELSGSFSPDFGQGDWKAITEQLVTKNRVSPDISKIQYFAGASLVFSPIYGKIAVTNRGIVSFDLFMAVGAGVVNTKEDLEALQADTDPTHPAWLTASQNHPTTNLGGGVRVVFAENFAARLDIRTLSYIETVSGHTLEMKNNFLVLGGASFFFPNMK
ncbi:MAG: outer membrane beta-barrel domain-containing protein [Proteobacteria bacterium]|nr:outer membrane beta-barrel domain-containing protein [Pseudomonadota bacterium]